jgi:hypothetical protein|tara:strand:- start:178 stop:300 length:123 start_codon:yes stop_codon:yes gene_type:complete
MLLHLIPIILEAVVVELMLLVLLEQLQQEVVLVVLGQLIQ